LTDSNTATALEFRDSASECAPPVSTAIVSRPVLAERAIPRQRVLVASLDERPVDVEERRARYEVAAALFAACCSCFPSANSSISFLLNAGMSSGRSRQVGSDGR
jgi:hypothetical protein